MIAQTSDLHEILERLEKVEAQIKNRNIEAESIALVNTDGDLRAVLWADDNNIPKLDLYDSGQNVRLRLAVFPDGTPGFVLLDEGEKPRVEVALSEDGSPHIYLFDKEGNISFKTPSI